MSNAFEQLPSVNDFLLDDRVDALVQKHGRKVVKKCIQNEIDNERQQLLNHVHKNVDYEKMIDGIEQDISLEGMPSLRPVVNCTGVVLHTNLGRSVLSNQIKNHINDVAFGYSNLEFDLGKRERGDRYSHVSKLLEDLTGAEDALVVNNNAAAVLLILDTLAKNRKILVSRGELVEIGGSFRIPEIITSVGGELQEVGTTNKTHPDDYENALDDETAAILKVHTSNYKIIGFTESVSERFLKGIANKHDIPLITDLGSGLLVDLSQYGVQGEPTVPETVLNSDLVAFSGDKLLGGPQAGIIVGKRKYIEQIKENQLLRALRVDKLTLSALEATLKIYEEGTDPLKDIPTLRMLTVPYKVLKEKASRMLGLLRNIPALEVSTTNGYSEVGGGTFPALKLKTFIVKVKSRVISTVELERQLRKSEVPIIVRIQSDAIELDVRTIFDDQIELITESIKKIVAGNKA